MEDVKEALFQYHRTIYGAFSYYAVLASAQEYDDIDAFNVTFNGYLAFLRDCKIATKGSGTCPMRECETIWVIANAVDKEMQSVGTMRFKSQRALNRQVWLTYCLLTL